MSAIESPRIGSDYGERKCPNLACGVLTYAAEWCPGCGSMPAIDLVAALRSSVEAAKKRREDQ